MRRRRLLVTLAAASALVVGLQSAGAGGTSGGFAAPTVSPTSGPPGTTFTVSGTGCIEELFAEGGAVIVLDVTVTVEFVPTPVTVETTAAESGAWSVQVTVPADAQPGAVAVNAECHDPFLNGEASGAGIGPAQVSGVYPASSFTVTAGAAAPVEASPNVTG
jgi:hypothetical protein